MTNRHRSITNLLKGDDDMRSIGKAAIAADKAATDPAAFRALIHAVLDKDPVIGMRAADAAEKASRVFPSLLEEHRKEILALLKKAQGKQLRWHLAMMVNYMVWDERETIVILNTLLHWYRTDPSKIVQVNCLDTLCSIALKQPAFAKEIRLITEEALIKGAPSLRARAKKLIKLFDAQTDEKSGGA